MIVWIEYVFKIKFILKRKSKSPSIDCFDVIIHIKILTLPSHKERALHSSSKFLEHLSILVSMVRPVIHLNWSFIFSAAYSFPTMFNIQAEFGSHMTKANAEPASPTWPLPYSSIKFVIVSIAPSEVELLSRASLHIVEK